MRVGKLGFLVLVAFVAAGLAGCGGSSSSSTGPTGGAAGSGATIQGQIVRTGSAAAEESVMVAILRTAFGIGLAEAQDGAMPLTVELLDENGNVVASTETDAMGNFEFRNVLPGTYSIRVDETIVAEDIVVGEGDLAVVSGQITTNGDVTAKVDIEARDISNIVQNDAQLGHAINIAEASSNCELEGVIDRREAGNGWGVIARQCNTHPSVIGLGHSNLSAEQMTAARDRLGRGKGGGKSKGGKGGKGPKKA